MADDHYFDLKYRRLHNYQKQPHVPALGNSDQPVTLVYKRDTTYLLSETNSSESLVLGARRWEHSRTQDPLLRAMGFILPTRFWSCARDRLSDDPPAGESGGGVRTEHLDVIHHTLNAHHTPNAPRSGLQLQSG